MTRSKEVGFAAVLVIAAFAIYWPAIHGQFIWDDAAYVTESPLVPARDGLSRMWFTTDAIDYWPITNSMYWVEWRIWGTKPTGYHVVSILLHAANALVFWLLLRRLSVPGAALAALLVVVHPLNVESVAWIAEGKNTLSLLFALLSTLAFIASEPTVPIKVIPPKRERAQSYRDRSRNRERHVESPVARKIRGWYVLSIMWFAAGMLSKGSVATLPGILLVLVWWRRGRITVGDIRRIVPFVVIAISLTLVNIWFQGRHVTTILRDVTLPQRVLGAGGVVWFYFLKALLPVNLMFVYPQWQIRAQDLGWWLPLMAAAIVTALLWWKRRESAGRPLLCMWLVAGLALVPVMGLSDAYYMRYSLVADRYAYIALLPMMAAVAATAAWLVARAQPVFSSASTFAQLLASCVLVALGLATWNQCHLYADADTLWTTTLKQNPRCWLCHANVAVPLIRSGRPEDLRVAIDHLNTAIRLNRDAPESYDGLGVALQKSGHYEEAVAAHERALALNPRFREAHANLVIAREHLGLALVQAGRFDDAAQVLRAAVQDAPDHGSTHRNLADALLRLGRIDESLVHARAAIRFDPSSADNHNTLATVYRSAHRPKEAVAEYREAVRLAPNLAVSHNNLGMALLEDDQLSEAAHELREAIRCDPLLPAPHRNLGVTLAEMNQLEDAAAHLQEALRLAPSFSDAQMNLDEVRRRMRKK